MPTKPRTPPADGVGPMGSNNTNWNLNPNISDQTFVLSAPEGYTQAKFVDMKPEHLFSNR